MTHGTRSAYNRGCRCEACREASRLARARQRDAVRIREIVSEKLPMPPKPMPSMSHRRGVWSSSWVVGPCGASGKPGKSHRTTILSMLQHDVAGLWPGSCSRASPLPWHA